MSTYAFTRVTFDRADYSYQLTPKLLNAVAQANRAVDQLESQRH